MSRSTTHRSGDIAFNGKLLHMIQFGLITAANSTQKFRWLSPCDGTIVRFEINIVAQLTNAAAALQCGLESSLQSILANLDIHSYATGYADLTPLLASTSVTKGSVYTLSVIDGDTTGTLVPNIIIEPR